MSYVGQRLISTFKNRRNSLHWGVIFVDKNCFQPKKTGFFAVQLMQLNVEDIKNLFDEERLKCTNVRPKLSSKVLDNVRFDFFAHSFLNLKVFLSSFDILLQKFIVLLSQIWNFILFETFTFEISSNIWGNKILFFCRIKVQKRIKQYLHY